MATNSGLSVSNIVNVTVNLTPLSAARRGFGTLCIAGDSDVIDTLERVRTFTDLDSVAALFGMDAPEYKAAALYFSQSPHPLELMIGRYAPSGASAVLRGGVLGTTEQDMAAFHAITAGAFQITLNGTPVDVTGVNLSTAANLHDVAAAITTKLSSAGTCNWDGSRFTVRTAGVGATQTITVATTTALSTLMKIDSAGASGVAHGSAAESPAECALALAETSGAWYGLMFATTSVVTPDQYLDVAGYIQGTGQAVARILGITITDSGVLDAVVTNDLASQLKALNYDRTCVQYSTSSPYAIASMFSRAFAVNFNANRSVITLKFKQEPGVIAEVLTQTQANVLKSKRCNVFVQYQNDTAIIQEGVMSGNAFFDERHALDWYANALQTELYNLLYTSPTKIPQTEAGVNQLYTTCAAVSAEGVRNGAFAPGVWNSEGFGTLERGQVLTAGYYIYFPPINEQSQSEREQRKAPVGQIAVKLAGAFHYIDAIVNVNR